MRVLALIEIVLGAGVLLVDVTAVRVAVGVLYAGFLAFVLLALWRSAPITSCGCFGSEDAPPSLGHVAMNATGAAVAFVAAADRVDALLDALTDSVGNAAALIAGTAVVTLVAAALLSGWRPSR